MYVANIHIKNFRCFRDTNVEFQPGLNVIIGENNAGKTTLMKALGYIFDRQGRSRPHVHDFHHVVADYTTPPVIEITVFLRSSDRDTLDDKAVVSTWLTKLEAPWEAKLTYRFFLPDDHLAEYTKLIGDSPTHETYLTALELLIPKYVSRIYGGEKTNLVQAEPDLLGKFEFHFLAAIRDVESDLFAGSNPLLRSMLREVLDWDIADNVDEQTKRKSEFRRASKNLHDDLKKRLSLSQLFNLVTHTGAVDGGSPELAGQLDETDLIAALRLFLRRADLAIPATHNGLGYNNLIYISVLLASLDFRADDRRRGQNAVLFPMLAIEEPEAHLHPALQYKLLKYVQRRLQKPTARTNDAQVNEQPVTSDEELIRSRQVFLTSHSTHITAAAGLEPIICLSLQGDNTVTVAYPSRVFGNDADGEKSRKYVERYLDATKSNMLFAKGVILVEGMAELLLVPCFAEILGTAIEDHHVAVVAVEGVNFKHFVKLFGGCDAQLRAFALSRPAACLLDADPLRKAKAESHHKSCWPYQLDVEPDDYEYRRVSFTVDAITTSCAGVANLKVCHGIKTLEYDLAHANYQSHVLLCASISNIDELKRLATSLTDCGTKVNSILDSDGIRRSLEKITELPLKHAATFATCYLRSVESKGESAFDMAHHLRHNHSLEEGKRLAFTVPDYIRDAIHWACRHTPAAEARHENAAEPTTAAAPKPVTSTQQPSKPARKK